MNLNDVHQKVHKNKKPRRVGRGESSGRGKTAGRGHKGQGQLAGWTMHPAFEGGQMPLVRRIPKRGFHNRWALTVAEINVGELDALFEAGEAVTPESLQDKGRLKARYDVLKILGQGQLTKQLKVSAHRFSKSAAEKIQNAGGEMIVLPPRGAAKKDRAEASAGKKKPGRAAAKK
jgi:large subunit ribosomal protein L15